jgi:hypothetical protein
MSATKITLNSDFLLHSTDDQPAVDNEYIQMWFNNGIIHRVGNPAVILPSIGTRYYYNNGMFDNGDKPAVVVDTSIICKNGAIVPNKTSIIMNNFIPESSDRAYAICTPDVQIHMTRGHPHCLAQPSITVTSANYSAWYINGKCQRAGKMPAIIYGDITRRSLDHIVIHPVTEMHVFNATDDKQNIVVVTQKHRGTSCRTTILSQTRIYINTDHIRLTSDMRVVKINNYSYIICIGDVVHVFNKK